MQIVYALVILNYVGCRSIDQYDSRPPIRTSAWSLAYLNALSVDELMDDVVREDRIDDVIDEFVLDEVIDDLVRYEAIDYAKRLLRSRTNAPVVLR